MSRNSLRELFFFFFHVSTTLVALGLPIGGISRSHSDTPQSVRLLKADSHIACRAHAVPLPCRAVKGLECVFPI
jgi:hypothetical protein